MADAGIKKVVISQDQLLHLNLPENAGDPLHYLVRYRVISEDKTKVSAWSKIYSLEAKSIPDIIGSAGAISVSSTTDIVTLSWVTPDILSVAEYDIYVTWQDNNGSILDIANMYVGSVSASKNNSFSLPMRSGAKHISARIQVSTKPKGVSDNALVAEVSNKSI